MCHIAEEQHNREIQAAGPAVRLPELEVRFCLLQYMTLQSLCFGFLNYKVRAVVVPAS